MACHSTAWDANPGRLAHRLRCARLGSSRRCLLATSRHGQTFRCHGRARNEIQAGNVYINRHITGAVVGRQPFGGYGMSGVGSKAGGPDYLLQFLDPRVVT